MDQVLIEGLQLEAVIGVYEWERRIQQRIVLDVVLGCDTRKAGHTDMLSDAIDYKAVSKRLQAIAQQSNHHLVEALAEDMIETIQSEFGVPWIRLTLRKPGAVTGSSSVGVVVERGTPDAH